MKKRGNQIVVAKNPPNKKLTKGRNKITFLSQKRDTSIGAKESRVVGERPVKPKEQLRQGRPELEKMHGGRGILSLVREAHEELSEVEAEEKHHEGDEIEEEREDYKEEEEDEIGEISAKKWTGRYQWSEQMTDTYCETLVDIIRAGGRSDSGFKTPVWPEVCLRLKKKHGLQACSLTPKHCKNKYDNVRFIKEIQRKQSIQS